MAQIVISVVSAESLCNGATTSSPFPPGKSIRRYAVDEFGGCGIAQLRPAGQRGIVWMEADKVGGHPNPRGEELDDGNTRSSAG